MRLEGKTGREAKDVVSIKEQYKPHQEKLNRALDNAVFKSIADFLHDNQFDLDKKEDRVSMKYLIEKELARPMDEIRKQAFLDSLLLLDEIDAAMEGRTNAEKKVISDTRKEVENLRSDILADLNNNLVA